ncbi:hypothetical protein PUN28_012097 [Cardiocondyla obscurior]|uniref:Uncharacterized protein n=1 Tax=Cardiocondyla obscurior TaxID=286306 RepID=A0AAW2FDB9_9HYME
MCKSGRAPPPTSPHLPPRRSSRHPCLYICCRCSPTASTFCLFHAARQRPCNATPCISDVTALSQGTTADRNRAIQLAHYTAVLMRIDDARVAYACTCISLGEVV